MSAREIAPSMPPAALEAAEPTATALLTIDLGALRANYRTLRDLAGEAECAAVIKANAYGTGDIIAATALAQEGCRTFFVATFNEGTRVRGAVPQATVYVLDGFFPQSGDAYIESGLRPVLSSAEDLADWITFCRDSGAEHPSALHVDTGMNRLGLRPEEAVDLLGAGGAGEDYVPALLISHLACADEPDHPKNAEQLHAFEKLLAQLPKCPASLANSGGIFLGQPYHFDLVRAGFALYGGRAVEGRPTLAPVVQLHGRIAQVREADAGETVGYGAAQRLERRSRIATISLGYADGIFRHLGAGGAQSGLVGYIGEHEVPILGRISMDLITLDVTDIPEDLAVRGGWVEILGPHVRIDDLAERAGTIGYEVLTSLGSRAQRVFIEPGQEIS